MMDYDKLWNISVEKAVQEWRSLDPALKSRLKELVSSMMLCKKDIHRIIEGAGSKQLCSDCGGICCTKGKYHFSTVDLLAFFATDTPLFSPDFDNGSCPYLSGFECLMSPEFRPYTCVTFSCDSIEADISELDKSKLGFHCEHLKSIYDEIQSLFSRRLTGGFLHYAEEWRSTGGGILLSRLNN